MPKLNRGYLVVFEGIDGAGKTTQAKMLHGYLNEKGMDAVFTREPTGGEFGQKIRQLAQGGRDSTSAGEEYELFILDRKQHCKALLEPALADKRVIICDRYYFSTIAYQGAIGLDPRRIQEENEAFAPIPDIVFILSVDPRIGLKRIQEGRKETPNAFEQEDNLNRAKAIFDVMSDDYIVKINGESDIGSIHQQVIDKVDSIIGGVDIE